MKIFRRSLPAICLLIAPLAFGQVPALLNHQGLIRVGGTNFTGTGQFQFALVNNAGAATYWSNGTGVVTMPVSQGLYAVLLGDTNLANMAALPVTVFTNGDVRLRVWFNDGVAGPQLLAPDQRIVSVAYALLAQTVPDGAITSNKLAPGAVTAAALGIGTITSNQLAAGAVDNTKLANNSLTVTAGSGLSGGGAVALGGSTTVAANLNHDTSLTGNGGSVSLGLNLGNANTWTASQAINGGLQVSGDVSAARLNGGSGNILGTSVSATIAGGRGNSSSDDYTFIGGGESNQVYNHHATIGGGINNRAARWATVGGGEMNSATEHSFIGGGLSNSASGYAATVPGGANNTASGQSSFAAGQRAKAQHAGAFVWADNTAADFSSTTSNQFLIRASGGVGIGTNGTPNALTVAGTVQATSFVGNGSGLTGLSNGVPADGTITSNKLAPGAVTTAAIATGAITSNQLAAGTVDNTKLANNSLTVTAGSGLSGGGVVALGGSTTVAANLNHDTSLTGNGGAVSLGLNLGSTNTWNASQTINGGLTVTGDMSAARLNVGTGNTLSGSYATIGGGLVNSASAAEAVVAGGFSNIVSATAAAATVSGGQQNTASGAGSVIGGGQGNTSGSYVSTIGGGYQNSAFGGNAATVAGGYQNTASSWEATVGGGYKNTASSYQATVGGGSYNRASWNYATVSGGFSNTASQWGAAVSGGEQNIANNTDTTVSGGLWNTASGWAATVTGGFTNLASGNGSVVGGEYNVANNTDTTVPGGRNNTASGYIATVAGGYSNTASGSYSFAAGQHAAATNDGAFVWGDNSASTTIASTASNQFTARAAGGVRFFSNSGATLGAQLAPNATSWTALSDRNAKQNIEPVDARAILAQLIQLPVSRWSYKADPAQRRYIGPMAQDFHAAFNLGDDDKRINTLDTDGVTLAAIQGLYQELQDEKTRNATLEKRLSELEQLIHRIARTDGK